MLENIDLSLIKKSSLPNRVKLNKIKKSKTTSKTKKFSEKPCLQTILCFTQSHPGSLNNSPKVYIQKYPRIYNLEKPLYITRTDNVPLNCDCINGSIVNGGREPIFHSFALDKPPSQKA